MRYRFWREFVGGDVVALLSGLGGVILAFAAPMVGSPGMERWFYWAAIGCVLYAAYTKWRLAWNAWQPRLAIAEDIDIQEIQVADARHWYFRLQVRSIGPHTVRGVSVTVVNSDTGWLTGHRFQLMGANPGTGNADINPGPPARFDIVTEALGADGAVRVVPQYKQAPLRADVGQGPHRVVLCIAAIDTPEQYVVWRLTHSANGVAGRHMMAAGEPPYRTLSDAALALGMGRSL